MSSARSIGAQSVVLAWDANTDSITTGYALYTKNNLGAVLSRLDVGTNTTATVSNLADGMTYTFYVTAYNSANLESAPSNEVTNGTAAPNSAPTAHNKNVQTLQDQSVQVVLSGSDADGNALTFSVVSHPTRGTLSGTAPSLTYTPTAGFSGTDSFTYRASDGSLNSAPATVNIVVTAPSSSGMFYRGINVGGSAVTIDGHNWEGDNAPNSTADGTVYITPFTAFNPSVDAEHSIMLRTLRYSEDLHLSMIGVPNGTYDVYVWTCEETTPLTATLSVEGSVVSVYNSGPAGRWDRLGPYPVVVNDGNIQVRLQCHTPFDSSFISGLEVWQRSVALPSPPVVVNQAPTANALTVQLSEDQSKGITLAGSDSNGDALTFTVTGGPSYGILTGTAPNLVYAPNANYSGNDSFTYRVGDGSLNSSAATVTITILPVNDAPIANAKTVQTLAGQAVQVALSGSDPDGNTLTFSVVSSPTRGTLSGTAPALTYTPTLGLSGTDSFTYRANNGSLNSAPATVSITVTAVANRAPTANPLTVPTSEDQPVSITLAGSDPDGNALTFAVVSGPSHGVLTGTAPNWVFTPAANYSGADTFTYRAHDGSLSSSPATVTISVLAVNDPPVANNLSVVTVERQPLDIRLAGNDVESDPLSFATTGSPSHGVLSGTTPNLVYTPAQGYVGTDSFQFIANDGNANSTPATVNISVASSGGRIKFRRTVASR